MKLLTLLFGLGILTTLLVSCHAGLHQRSLEKSRINNTKEEISLLKQDVLDLITSTLNPSKHSTKTEASNHVTESITQPTFQPITLRETELTGEQLQKIPEDTPSIEVKYEQKISLKEESPKTDSENSKNETIKRDYNNLFMFKFNQSSPLSHTSSEVTLSQSSYEQSSVVYEEEDEDHSPEYEDFTRTGHSKYISERKKKKKEILDMVTVPTQWSTKKQVNETNKEKTQTDALDDRPSTTSNKIESNINSLDVSLTTISNKENILSQSGNNVISHYSNDSSTKKPRMTYSVKKSAVINDTSTVSSDIAGNTVPVLKWEKATTKPNIDSKPINLEIEKSSVVKSNVEFKHRLGLNPIAKVNNGDDVTETSIEVVLNTTSKYSKDIKHHKLAKNTLEEVSTSTAWIPVATMKSSTSYKHLTKPATTEKVIPTEAMGKVKEMFPWLTRLQRSSTTPLSSLNANLDSITVNPKSITDSETSSSWKKFKTTSTEEGSDSTTSSTTTEMIHNSTEPSNEDNITITVDIISDKPLSPDDFTSEFTSSERDVAFTTIRQDSTMENTSTSTEIEAISETNLTSKDITTTVMNKVESVTEEMAIPTTGTPIASIANPENQNVSDVTNSSGNKTLSLDMNQTSNDLKVNNTDMKTDLNKVHTIKTNDSIHESVLDDDILEEKALTDEFDDETKKEMPTTHIEFPEVTTAQIPDSGEEPPDERANEEDDEELDKPKQIPTENEEIHKNIPHGVILNFTDVTEIVTGKMHEGDWYNVSIDDVSKLSDTTTKSIEELKPKSQVPDVVPTTPVRVEPELNFTENTTMTTSVTETTEASTTIAHTTKASTTTTLNYSCFWEKNPPPKESVENYISLVLQTSWPELCQRREELRSAIINTYSRKLLTCQVLFFNLNNKTCSNPGSATEASIFIYFVDVSGKYDDTLLKEFNEDNLPFTVISVKTAQPRLSSTYKQDGTVFIVVCLGGFIAVVTLLSIIIFIFIRKRRQKFNYGQRCTPVSLEDYSLDNISVYNSVRRKGAFRASKRSYGNPAFDDPHAPSHSVNFAGLANLCNNREALDEEFSQIPVISVKADELPARAETKNRYANVIPLPETRVQLIVKEGADPLDEYINANYVKGPKGIEKFYIACQAPLQSTVTDFWRMIWQEQCKVIIMLTSLEENGVEKCADYLPPSQVIDCHCLFGDYQITLKKHEVREKYFVSNLQIKNLESNSWREVTHLWYTSWPTTGVPEECNSMLSFLMEAHSYMRSSTGPTVVHCSPGTGRTGAVMAIDLCIREFESSRTVDIPKTVYALRRSRAGAVQTKDQYAFIYKALNLYATKLTGGALDSI